MAHSCTVLIASADVAAGAENAPGQRAARLLAFTDAEALRALEIDHRAAVRAVVALERVFAATPRGAALINRIKADPSLKQSEIRVVSPETDVSRWSRRRRQASLAGERQAAGRCRRSAARAARSARHAARAARSRSPARSSVMVDGNPATLVDLRRSARKWFRATVLKPNQRFRMSLSDEHGIAALQCLGRLGARSRSRRTAARAIAPASSFSTPTPLAVDAYAQRHRIESSG